MEQDKKAPISVFVCSRGRHTSCGVAGCTSKSTKLCDFPLMGAKEGKTCDKPLCVAHTHRVGHQTIDGKRDSRDYCPTHFELTRGK